MHKQTMLVLSVMAILPLLFAVAEPACTHEFLDLAGEANLTSCKKLPTLEAELAWNYRRRNRTTLVDILFGVRHQENLRWFAWGVHPGGTAQMVGTRAIIGILLGNGSVAVATYNLTGRTKLGCRLEHSPIEPRVSGARGQVKGQRGFATLYAAVELDDTDYDVARLGHTWQVGYEADAPAMEPQMHRSGLQNFDSAEIINMTSAESPGSGDRWRHLRTVHGILNMVGWGVLLPVGVIVARYFSKFPFDYSKQWFCLHVSCQIAGYTIGTAGWGVGLTLGHASKHYSFHTHRLLAHFIFAFATLQMLALRLRPKAQDDYRKHWDMYHHFLGYALLAAMAVNMFHGIAILHPNLPWKWAYIAILAALAVVAFSLELYTWQKFLVEKHNKDKDKDKDKDNDKDNDNKNKDNKD